MSEWLFVVSEQAISDTGRKYICCVSIDHLEVSVTRNLLWLHRGKSRVPQMSSDTLLITFLYLWVYSFCAMVYFTVLQKQWQALLVTEFPLMPASKFYCAPMRGKNVIFPRYCFLSVNWETFCALVVKNIFTFKKSTDKWPYPALEQFYTTV